MPERPLSPEEESRRREEALARELLEGLSDTPKADAGAPEAEVPEATSREETRVPEPAPEPAGDHIFADEIRDLKLARAAGRLNRDQFNKKLEAYNRINAAADKMAELKKARAKGEISRDEFNLLRTKVEAASATEAAPSEPETEPAPAPAPDTLASLKLKRAKGEISREEFEQRKAALEPEFVSPESPPPPPPPPADTLRSLRVQRARGEINREEFERRKASLEPEPAREPTPEPTPQPRAEEVEGAPTPPEVVPPPPSSPEAARREARELLETTTPEERRDIVRGIRNIGFIVEERKNRGLAGVLKWTNEKLGNKKDKYFGRFLTALQKTYEKDAAVARKRIEGKEGGGIRKELLNISNLSKNIVKLAHIPLTLLGVLPATRFVLYGAMALARGGEAAKEARLEDEKVKEKTRIHDEEAAAEEAWQIYGEAQERAGRDWTSRENLSKEDLEKAYLEQLPHELLERIERNDPDSFLLRFLIAFARTPMLIGVEHVGSRLEKIENNDNLSAAEKRKKKDQILSRWEKHLKDLDRMATQTGTLDAIALGAKWAEAAGKAVTAGAIAFTLEQAVEKLWLKLPEIYFSLAGGEVKAPVKIPEKTLSRSSAPPDMRNVPPPQRLPDARPSAPAVPPEAPKAPPGAPEPQLAPARPGVPAQPDTGPRPTPVEKVPPPPERAVAAPFVERKPFGIPPVEVAKEGDSIWRMSERQAEKRLGALFGKDLWEKDLNKARRTYIIDAFKDKAVVGMDNPDLIQPGHKVDFSNIYGTKEEFERLVKEAQRLTPEQMKNIEQSGTKTTLPELAPTAAKKFDDIGRLRGEFTPGRGDGLEHQIAEGADEGPTLAETEPPRDTSAISPTENKITTPPGEIEVAGAGKRRDLEGFGTDDNVVPGDERAQELVPEEEVPQAPLKNETPFGTAIESTIAKKLDFLPEQYNRVRGITAEKLLSQIPADEDGQLQMWSNFTRGKAPNLPHQNLLGFLGYPEWELRKQVRLAGYLRGLELDALEQKMAIGELLNRRGAR